jgi:multidrug transporter EmrE-like cation transporter
MVKAFVSLILLTFITVSWTYFLKEGDTFDKIAWSLLLSLSFINCVYCVGQWYIYDKK